MGKKHKFKKFICNVFSTRKTHLYRTMKERILILESFAAALSQTPAHLSVIVRGYPFFSPPVAVPVEGLMPIACFQTYSSILDLRLCWVDVRSNGAPIKLSASDRSHRMRLLREEHCRRRWCLLGLARARSSGQVVSVKIISKEMKVCLNAC